MRKIRKFHSITSLIWIACISLGFAAFAVYGEEGWQFDSSAPAKPQREPMAQDFANPDYSIPANAKVTHVIVSDGHAAPDKRAVHGPAAAKLSDVSAEKSLDKLRLGNLRFQQGKLRKQSEGVATKDRNRLLAGQTPHAIVLSCSDSRVPPEIIFDQRLGELFVVRSAGETLDKAVIASIEYAVAHLGVQLILVMGHDSCGAVTAALNSMPNAKSESAYIDYMVADIQPRIAGYFRKPASTGIELESAANARGVVRDLIQKSAIVRERLSSGNLQVRSSLYHLDSGFVDFH